MFLLGFVSLPAPEYKFELASKAKVLTILPTATGEVTYFLLGLPVPKSKEWLRHRSEVMKRELGTEKIRQFQPTITVNASACGATDWFYRARRTSSGAYGFNLCPLSWEGIENPPILSTDVYWISDLVSHPVVELLGSVPKPHLSPMQANPTAKPGETIGAVSELGVSEAGATMRSVVENKVTGKSASTITSLNADNSVHLSISDEMPALLPNEVVNLELSSEPELCDIRGMVENDEAYNKLMDKIKGVMPEKITMSATIKPTDCLLVDTKNAFQVLGDDLSYKGFIVSDDKIGPIEGEAPDTVKFSGLKYLRLKFNRDIAICEDKDILDKNGKTYEYSIFPTPFMLFQRGAAFAREVRPAMPWESVVPVPVSMVRGPKIEVR